MMNTTFISTSPSKKKRSPKRWLGDDPLRKNLVKATVVLFGPGRGGTGNLISPGC